MRHYSHEMHSLLRRTAGPEFGWGEGQNKALEIVSAAQDEVERLRVAIDKIRIQLDCSDKYEQQARMSDDILPSVWAIQNSHIRDLISSK